jgi:hypothetical protein
MIGFGQEKAKTRIKKRNRTRPLLSFQERLRKFGADVRAEAKELPPGTERSDLLQKARESEAAARCAD